MCLVGKSLYNLYLVMRFVLWPSATTEQQCVLFFKSESLIKVSSVCCFGIVVHLESLDTRIKFNDGQCIFFLLRF